MFLKSTASAGTNNMILKGCRFSAFLFMILVISVRTYGQGNLLITPRRIVFEGNKRSVDINLANIGQDTAVYAISFVNIRMKDDGSFETITTPDPGQKFADQNLRFFPRQVTLAPNEAQVVKLQLLRGTQLVSGEYRSHLYFRSVPRKVARGSEEAKKDSTAISVQITPIFGITIPAIIRVGQSDTRISISNMALTKASDGTPYLEIKFNRSGNFSAFGDLAVDHVSQTGTITRVGIANGVAIYTPNTVRSFKFNLNTPSGVDFKSGKLKVVFSAPSDVKPQKYAEAELLLK